MNEVKQSVFGMSPYKAPRPDGFQPIFFRNYQDIIAFDIWEMVATTFSTGHIPPGLAATLIVPIPKVDQPFSLKGFCPISLCNVSLKIISKLLVNCIQSHLNNFIGSLQSSFIPKRMTNDNAIIAQEIAHHMYMKKGKQVT